MLFNSLEFALFLPVVFALYWSLAGQRRGIQNALLLVASYVFYGWWDWRFLSLIAFSSLVDFLVGLRLADTNHPRRRKLLLLASICVNLGFLGTFKYFNFFADNFYRAFTILGAPVAEPFMLSIILPVGISFYTFQTLSYSIDVYLRKITPTRNIIDFFAFVSFFPQLVAGPIERAAHLLPQFQRRRAFDYSAAADGMRQILWGLFKKVVIADNCADVANTVFARHENYSGSTLVIGAVCFAFQIYGDFSGYSDIALGTSRLFGFRLKRNFAFPYFSRDMAEFWRRWHISLSSWFRDYVYIPLGGSRGRAWVSLRNIFLIFVVSGFWHGANWTFIIWGALNALYFLPLFLARRNRVNADIVAKGKWFPSVREMLQMGITFGLTTLAWIIFRADSVSQAGSYLAEICSSSLLAMPEILPRKVFLLLGVFFLVEWFQREREHGLDFSVSKCPLFIRWGVYYGTGLLILLFAGEQQEFIYFQF